jgi:hypothetical protein
MYCSFCNLPGHNIRSCNDISLIDIHYDRMKKIYLNIIRKVFPHNIRNYTELGKSILNAQFSMRELRGVNIKYLNVNMSNKENLILNIWRYFQNRILYIFPEQSLELGIIPPVELIDMATPSSVVLPFSSENYRIINNYYSGDLVLVTYMVPMIRVLTAEAEEINHTTSDVNKKYNIMPILCLEEEDKDKEEEDINCAICYENIKCVDLVSLNCSHQFCSSCIIGILKTNKSLNSPTCALCREVMCVFNVKKLEIYNLVAEHCDVLLYVNG